MDPKEIDKERGVINEEWRTRMSAMMRMQEKLLPMMYPGDKYTHSLPTGTMDVVMNFKPQTLRDYYEKWYRPDLQGIVIVGDIDVDAVEAKIKTMFADIPAQPNAAERIYYPVADNKEPIICILKDKEQPHVQVLLFNKHEAVPDNQKGNVDYLIQQYAKNLISIMLNARLNELVQTANPPYIYAGTDDSNFFVAKTKDAFLGIVVCKEDSIENGIAAMLRELVALMANKDIKEGSIIRLLADKREVRITDIQEKQVTKHKLALPNSKAVLAKALELKNTPAGDDSLDDIFALI